MEALIGGPRPYLALFLGLLSMTLAWFVYVPIHELLHVAGCVLTGGSVSELQIQAEYGGALLARVFDFVVVGGDYSGRLSGFDTHGSDFVYLATVFAPYIPSIFLGVPLLQLSQRRSLPWLFGPGIVVGLAPFYSLIGDYFEMGSILVTRALTTFAGGGNPPLFEALRSDDVILLIQTFAGNPGSLGLEGHAAGVAGAAVIGSSLLVAVALGLVTYAAGVGFSHAVLAGGVPEARTHDSAGSEPPAENSKPSDDSP